MNYYNEYTVAGEDMKAGMPHGPAGHGGRTEGGAPGPGKVCIACGAKLPASPLFVLKDAPASAQDIPDAEEVKQDRGVDLGLYQCGTCGLVQFDCTPVSYYRDVIRAGGFSTTMTELRRRQYRHLIETYHLEGKKFLEVGCGRGEFIKVLTEFPVQVYGMEHKADLVETAQADGLCVWQEFPEEPGQVFAGEKAGMMGEMGGEIHGPFDVFLSFNFLEHQPEPDVMLQAIRRNLAEDGMGLVTVPALEYILEQGSYYELIRDHIAYYSFDTLGNLLTRNGFTVLEEEMLNRDTISMIVKKNPDWAAGDGSVKTAGTPGSETSDAARILTAGYDRVNQEIRHLLEELTAKGETLAVWGASHQGFTLAATTDIGIRAGYIIDSAPFKQGRYAPASHLPIVAPEHFRQEPVDVVLIVAPGYTGEIAGIIRQRFTPCPRILTLRTDHIEQLLLNGCNSSRGI